MSVDPRKRIWSNRRQTQEMSHMQRRFRRHSCPLSSMCLAWGCLRASKTSFVYTYTTASIGITPQALRGIGMTTKISSLRFWRMSFLSLEGGLVIRKLDPCGIVIHRWATRRQLCNWSKLLTNGKARVTLRLSIGIDNCIPTSQTPVSKDKGKL